jgi:basic membrane protein A
MISLPAYKPAGFSTRRGSSMPATSRLPTAIALLLLAIAAPAGEALKVGLILAGSATDGGWNQLAAEALAQVKAKLGAQVSVIQKVTQDKAGDELRDYAADGFQLVIAHGYEFLNPAAEAARTISATKFAVSGADVARPGIATLDFDLSQASYQLGIIAGRLTRSGRLGFVGGAPFPSVKACYRGFLAGARSVKPEATVAEAYTSWDEPVKSKSQTEAFLRQGIDLVFHDVDAASRGVFEAIREHNAKDPANPAYAFGSVADQNASPICAPFIPASAVIRLDTTFLRLATAVRDGAFKPGIERENIALGTCVAVLNPALIGTLLTPALQAEVEEAGRKLAAGTIAIPAE